MQSGRRTAIFGEFFSGNWVDVLAQFLSVIKRGSVGHCVSKFCWREEIGIHQFIRSAKKSEERSVLSSQKIKVFSLVGKCIW